MPSRFILAAPQSTNEYSLDHYQHKFYLRSNRNVKTLLYRTARNENAREELIPPREHIMR